ncbi:hypothetical protein [Pseudomonas sp. RC10]|uniref:hypothetical protein n=1 Tax=Pseudomonas bambusae TaxID=3139142 RepID=UPI0031387623
MDVKFILDWSVVLCFLLTLIDAAVLLWVVLFRLEQIEDALGNSKINVEARRLGSSTGLLGRQYRLGLATSVMLFSNMYIRKGLVDPDDVKNMPTHLKRWAVIPNVAAAVLLMLSFIWALMTGKI